MTVNSSVIRKVRPPLSKELQLSIFRRDRWICRWCNHPPYYHAHWTRRDAPLLDELGAVIDHVEAHSTGGLNSEENLATACNKCNGRKSNAAKIKWGKRSKRQPIKGKYGEPQRWDGLSGVFVILAQRDKVGLSASEKAWLKELSRDE